MTDYIIVEALRAAELVTKVQELIGAGWEPQGGITTLPDGSVGQAMVHKTGGAPIGVLPQNPGPC